MLFVVSIVNLLMVCLCVYFLFSLIQFNKIKHRIIQTKVYNKISEYLVILIKRKLIPTSKINLNPFILLSIMIILFFVSFILINSYLEVPITSLILSLPFSISPILVIKILLNKEKSHILKQMPLYIVNIKNHIESDNNIIGAIQKTTVDEPLKKYIVIFKNNISRGMNVIEAFRVLKEDVAVKAFTDYINACEVCYLNGGDFNKLIERYIKIITKENIHKESAKEKAYADILTLIIMMILNVLVIIMFVFTNKEYAEIMKETFFGNVVLTVNAISYILIAYLISRIYKEE